MTERILPGAAEAFRAAAELRRGQVAEAPADPHLRRLQMADDNSLGSALAGQRDFASGLAAFRDGLAAARALDAREGADAQAHFDLAVSLNLVGWILIQPSWGCGCHTATS